MAIDLHQHLWPEPLVELLRARREAPYLRGWTLHTAGEAPYDVAARDHDPAHRMELDDRTGVALACLSLSSPLGIEHLPEQQATQLIDAWHLGAFDLPTHFAAWASVPAVEPDLDKLARLLAVGFIGVQLPASQLSTPAGWQSAGEVLRVAELAGKPVFIHPGQVESTVAPAWWAPVVGYTNQLQAAWWAWQAYDGRRQFPDLRLVFAAGAGLAPLQHERHVARGGSSAKVDPHVYVDTSSYGAQALDALIRALGIEALVLGSDRPYGEPALALFGEAATKAIRVENPGRVLGVAQVLEGVA